MRVPISVKIVEQSSESCSLCVREVRFFGFLIKKSEIIYEGGEERKPCGFNALPDMRVYIED